MTTENTNAMQAQNQTKASKPNELAIRLDALALEAQEALQSKGSFERAIAMGVAINNLREALNPKVMPSIMKLKGSALGFRTDERQGNQFQSEIIYGEEVVKEALIVATCQGLSPVGNQWNILAGRCYVTKEGMTYLLKNLKGLSDLKIIYHPAIITESSTSGIGKNGASYQKIEREGRVQVDLSWKFNNVSDSETLEFCIRVNTGMSQDAILGKAERKAKAWLYARLTDTFISEGEVEDSAPIRDVSKPKTVDESASDVMLASDAGEPIEADVVAAADPVSDPIADVISLANSAGISIDELHFVACAMRKMKTGDAELSADAAKALISEWVDVKKTIIERRRGGNK